jgi:hypothetical protein
VAVSGAHRQPPLSAAFLLKKTSPSYPSAVQAIPLRCCWRVSAVSGAHRQRTPPPFPPPGPHIVSSMPTEPPGYSCAGRFLALLLARLGPIPPAGGPKLSAALPLTTPPLRPPCCCAGRFLALLLARLGRQWRTQAAARMPEARGDIREIVGQPVFVPLYNLYLRYGKLFRLRSVLKCMYQQSCQHWNIYQQSCQLWNIYHFGLLWGLKHNVCEPCINICDFLMLCTFGCWCQHRGKVFNSAACIGAASCSGVDVQYIAPGRAASGEGG